MLPDLLDNIPVWQKQFRESRVGAAYHRMHMATHCSEMEDRWMMGIAVDVLVVGGGYWYLLLLA